MRCKTSSNNFSHAKYKIGETFICCDRIYNVGRTFPGVDQLLKVGGVNGRLTSGCLLPQVVEARTCRHLLEERADLLHRQRFVIALYDCRVENNA